MAYASWVHPDKTSGNNNDTVVWAGSAYSGRVSRSTTATFSAPGCEDKILTINQTGKPEYATMLSGGSVSKEGGSATVSGFSNSEKLTFRLENNGIGLVLPSTYVAAGGNVTNGSKITGDPGASSEYAFSINFTNIPANVSTSEKTTQIVVKPVGGAEATYTVRQAAGDAYLTITPSTIIFDYNGTAQNVDVTSNTSWSIS